MSEEMMEEVRLAGVTPELENRGMSPSTGKFQPGNKFGRPKGSRNKLTQQMLDRAAELNVAPDEILGAFMMDSTLPPDIRARCAMKLVDIIYPKAASVEVKMEEVTHASEEAINDQIKSFLSGALGVDVLPPNEDAGLKEEEDVDSAE